MNNFVIIILINSTVLMSGCGSTMRNKMKGCPDLPVTTDDLLQRYIVPSAASKEVEAQLLKTNPPKQPTELYLKFVDLDSKLSKMENKGCQTYRKFRFRNISHQIQDYRLKLYGSKGKTSKKWWFSNFYTDRHFKTFEDELKIQQRLESERKRMLGQLEIRERNQKLRKERAEALAERRRKEAEDRVKSIADREDWKQEILKKAKKHKYRDVVFDVSLSAVIQGLISGRVAIEDLTNLVIELNESGNVNGEYSDLEIIAIQSLNKNKTIYQDRNNNYVVILRKYGKLVIEKSPITAISNHYVVVKGITSYKNILRSTTQALIVETAWSE